LTGWCAKPVCQNGRCTCQGPGGQGRGSVGQNNGPNRGPW
jgi:hypothetical protein